MMRRAERGMTSLVGMMLLGVMLLAACGLLTLERQAAQEGRGYEAEVRLRLLAQSEAERAAVQLEAGGALAGLEMTRAGCTLLPERMTDDGCKVSVQAFPEDLRTPQNGKIVVTAHAMAPRGEDRVLPVRSELRVRARMRKGDDGYVWLGWMP